MNTGVLTGYSRLALLNNIINKSKHPQLSTKFKLKLRLEKIRYSYCLTDVGGAGLLQSRDEGTVKNNYLFFPTFF